MDNPLSYKKDVDTRIRDFGMKGQIVRFLDVILIGPIMMLGGVRLRKEDDFLGIALIGLGAATIGYNLKNYYEVTKQVMYVDFDPEIYDHSTVRFYRPSTRQKLATLKVAMPATPSAREHGLGGRSALNFNQGMLFYFPQPGAYTFDMKKVMVPLDIAFLDERGFVIEVFSLPEPGSDLVATSPPRTKYAIEATKNYFKLHNITRGDKVSGLPLMPAGV